MNRRFAFALIITSGALLMAGGCGDAQTHHTRSNDGWNGRSSVGSYGGNATPVSRDYGLASVADRLDSRSASASTRQAGQSDQTKRGDRPRSELIGLYGDALATPAGEPTPMRRDGASNLMQITHVTEGACFDPDVARDGDIIVYASTQHRLTSDIFVKSTSGRTPTQLTSDPADDLMPAISPDGRHVCFASNRSGNWDIWLTSVEGAPPVQITFDAEPELHPTWSPDGQHIAYCRMGAQSGRWEIWVTNVEKPGTPQFLTYGRFPSWNPDPSRSKIVFQRARERGSRLFSVWTIDYIGGEAMHPTEIVSAANAALIHPVWSPDGGRIAFVAILDPERQTGDRPDQADVWAVRLDGTGKTNLTNGESLNLYPAWGADGSIYFLSDRSGNDNIWAVATSRLDLSSPWTEEEGGLAGADPDSEDPRDR